MVQSISPPFTPHYPWLQGEPLFANELNAAIANAGHGMRVTDWLPGGQPDGTTNLTTYIQSAINSTAGHGALIFPANPANYMVGAPGLTIPSDSHLIIEAGATLQLLPSANSSMFAIQNGAADIFIELRGTLDGNSTQQTITGGQASGGITGGGGASSNVYIDGYRQGVITNFYHWPVNISCCTDGEVRGVAMTNSGNSCEFVGLSTKYAITAFTYNPTTGATTLTTATAHGLVPGSVFTVSGIVGSPQTLANGLQGEWTAGSGTTGNTVTYTANAGNGIFTVTAGSVAITVKSYNVGFSDCFVQNIRDIGICLYGGCVGSYVRACEIANSNGPLIYVDSAQPGINYDCEISGCYCHDGDGGGPAVESSAFNLKSRHSRIFNNTVVNCPYGIAIGEAYDVEVYGNLLHDNALAFEAASGQCGQISISHLAWRVNVWGNTIRNSTVAGYTGFIHAALAPSPPSTYNPSTGTVTLATSVAHGIVPGGIFLLNNPFGDGPGYLALKGTQTAIAGTTGTTLIFTAPHGLSLSTVTNASIYNYTAAVSSTITGGTYNPAYVVPPGPPNAGATVGLVTLTAPAHGLPLLPPATNPVPFVVSGITGTGAVTVLNGFQTAIAIPDANTIQFYDTPGLTMTITGGSVLPAAFGISINSPNYCRIANNRIGDYQTTPLMVAAIGGAWGARGFSEGNYYGPRVATGALYSFPADATVYINASTQGISYDSVTDLRVMTQQQLASGEVYFPPTGLTVAWNSVPGVPGRGEVDFLCGQGAGAPGGFNFLQVTNGGAINSSVGVGGSLLANDGYGNTLLGGALAHGAAQVQSLANAGTLTINPNTSMVLVQNSASIATGTIVLPTPPGQAFTSQNAELEINFRNGVGGLTVLPGGTLTLAPAITGLSVPAGASLNFIQTGTAWVRRIMM